MGACYLWCVYCVILKGMSAGFGLSGVGCGVLGVLVWIVCGFFVGFLFFWVSVIAGFVFVRGLSWLFCAYVGFQRG